MQLRRHGDFGSRGRAGDYRGNKYRERRQNPDDFDRSRRVIDSNPGSGSRPGFGRSDSVERRDYRELKDEIRSSRSPWLGRVLERADYGEDLLRRDEMNRKYQFCDFVDRDGEMEPKYRYDYSGIQDVDRGRILRQECSPGREYGGKRSMVQEDGDNGGGRYRLSGDIGATSDYHGTFASRDLDTLKDEGKKYPDPFLFDKLSAMERHESRQKSVFSSRDMSHFTNSKDYSGRSELASMPSGSRSSLLYPYQHVQRLTADVLPAKLTEPFSFFEHCQTRVRGASRDPEAHHKDLTGYRQVALIPKRADEHDDLSIRPRHRESEYWGDESTGLYTKRSLHEYDDYDPRDMLEQDLGRPAQRRLDDIEYMQERLSMQNQTASEYLDTGRLSDKIGLGGSPWKVFEREPEMQAHQHLLHDDEISKNRLKYDLERDVGAISHTERIRNSSHDHYETEGQQLVARRHDMTSDELNYGQSNRSMKNDYLDEEIANRNSRNTMSRQWDNLDRKSDRTYDEQWDHEYSDDPLPSKRLQYVHGSYREAVKRFRGAESGKISASDDWISPYDPIERVEEYSTSRKQFRSGGPKPKHLSRPGLFRGSDSKHANQKYQHTKNVWIRSKDDETRDVPATEYEERQHWLSSAKPEVSENSEEFGQLVHKFFLEFTKRINESPSTRKRYKEQGRAGSLFCIVCGRSNPKDFVDTRSLAAHCHMTRKAGLRSQHLGLNRAICVLMGWSIKTDASDVWAPHEVSSSEALTQKEDLILWPPVVIIHNISMLGYSSLTKEVITVEAVEQFLRDKGFSVGKMKICLGNPPDKSVMLVKFLGTFTGLRDVDKLHKYFVENQRGRVGLQKFCSGEGQSSKDGTMKAEERLLYGYMGIAEDLDKVDVDTKKKCSVKSYKEIVEFDDAPVTS